MGNIKDYKYGGSPNYSELFSKFIEVFGEVTKTNDSEFIETCFKYTDELRDLLPKIDNALDMQMKQLRTIVKDEVSEIDFNKHTLFNPIKTE